MLTFFSNTIIQPLCSRGRRQKNSTSLIHRSSDSRLSSLSSINLIFFIAVLLLATVAQATVAATGSDQFEIMMRRRMMAAPSAASARSSGAALSQSYSTASFGLGNKRGGSLLSSLSISRRGSVGNNHVGRRLASAATASWRDQHSSAAAAFITSLSVPSSTELIRQKHYDKNHFQYNCNNKNYFFSTTAAINQVPPSTRVTAIHATVPKSDEKHVKKSSSKPNSTTPKSINRKQTKKNVVTYDYTTIHNNPLPPNYTIKSKPKPNNSGNWNPSAPLEWCQNFGSRSPSMTQHLSTIIQLSPDDEGYIPPEVYNNEEYPNVTIVRTKEQAQIVLEALQQSKLTEPERIHACDTEVMDIDLSNVGPVGNGYVTCLSVYSGPDFDYGLNNDQGGATTKGTMLWIDNLDDATGILDEFKDWLEDETVMKVWHNYGFDRHVLWNEGIDVKGFGGDTSK